MCFSVQVERDLEKIAMAFKAKVSLPAFKKFEKLQKDSADLSAENLKTILGLKRKPSAPIFKEPKEDGRIYPGYFAPVIVFEEGQRVIKPMRYRVRPQGSKEEIPSQYNVFNARKDSLLLRKTWKSIFLKNHGLFPFTRFYEWVEKGGKKKLINFYPLGKDIMWAPVIFDHWQSQEGEIEFDSFALITTDPPIEIESQGHDRSPLFLSEKNWDLWLNPKKLNAQEALSLLEEQETVVYGHKF